MQRMNGCITVSRTSDGDAQGGPGQETLNYAIVMILNNQQLDAENEWVHCHQQNFVQTSVACQWQISQMAV